MESKQTYHATYSRKTPPVPIQTKPPTSDAITLVVNVGFWEWRTGAIDPFRSVKFLFINKITRRLVVRSGHSQTPFVKRGLLRCAIDSAISRWRNCVRKDSKFSFETRCIESSLNRGITRAINIDTLTAQLQRFGIGPRIAWTQGISC
jgi:hypothetical protein